MRVIPQTPSPEPEPEPEPLENRDISTLTRDELLELQRRAREAMVRFLSAKGELH